MIGLENYIYLFIYFYVFFEDCFKNNYVKMDNNYKQRIMDKIYF